RRRFSAACITLDQRSDRRAGTRPMAPALGRVHRLRQLARAPDELLPAVPPTTGRRRKIRHHNHHLPLPDRSAARSLRPWWAAGWQSRGALDRSWWTASGKNHGLVVMHNDAIFQVETQTTGQHHLLDVLAQTHHGFDAVAMGHADHV